MVLQRRQTCSNVCQILTPIVVVALLLILQAIVKNELGDNFNKACIFFFTRDLKTDFSSEIFQKSFHIFSSLPLFALPCVLTHSLESPCQLHCTFSHERPFRLRRPGSLPTIPFPPRKTSLRRTTPRSMSKMVPLHGFELATSSRALIQHFHGKSQWFTRRNSTVHL